MGARAATIPFVLALAAGCASGPVAAERPMPERAPRPPAHSPPAAAPRVEEPSVRPASNWESFTKTGDALHAEIERRAAALKSGPVGNRAVELASFRLAASGHELIQAGSLDGALEALERAVSLYGGNGYAYLYLAYVHHLDGRQDQAREFAASARRYLPRDEGVRAELEGLGQAIGAGAASAAK